MKRLGILVVSFVGALAVFAGVANAWCYPPAPAPSRDNNVALCYSSFQVDPLWSRGYADAVADVENYGWTEPVAVLGNVPGGTNTGAYHLTCQKEGTPTGSFVGGSGGFVFGPEYAPLASSALGFYPIVA